MNFSDETNQAPETDGKYPQETPHKSNPPASRPKTRRRFQRHADIEKVTVPVSIIRIKIPGRIPIRILISGQCTKVAVCIGKRSHIVASRIIPLSHGITIVGIVKAASYTCIQVMPPVLQNLPCQNKPSTDMDVCRAMKLRTSFNAVS